MTLDLRLLRSFVTIVEAGSFTQAAGRLHIAQQSLSGQMRTLEAQTGARLLDRSSRGVTPTAVGEVLLDEARALLDQADRAAAAVRRAADGTAGELRIAFLASISHYLMPPVVRAFIAQHPDIALRAEELPIAELVDGLRRGRLDAGLSRPPLVDDLAFHTVMTEPVAAVLPAGHPLTSRAEVALSELAGERWVLTARSTWPPWHAQYDEDFAQAGFVPEIVERGTNVPNLLALVAAGVGITRLPLSARGLRASGVVFVPLAGAQTRVVLVRHPDHRRRALNPFTITVRDVAASLGQTHSGVSGHRA